MRCQGLAITDVGYFHCFQTLSHVFLPLLAPHNTLKKANIHFNFVEMMFGSYVSCPMSHGFK